MHAHQIPEHHLERTADVVRLARAATPGTRAVDIKDQMTIMHPEASERDIIVSMEYAARMLDTRE